MSPAQLASDPQLRRNYKIRLEWTSLSTCVGTSCKLRGERAIPDPYKMPRDKTSGIHTQWDCDLSTGVQAGSVAQWIVFASEWCLESSFLIQKGKVVAIADKSLQSAGNSTSQHRASSHIGNIVLCLDLSERGFPRHPR